MSISELHAKADRLEKELQETRDQIARETHDSEVVTAELARTRAYAFSAQADPVEELVTGCADSLSRYGFCVIDNVIPRDQVDAIRDEMVEAQAAIRKNVEGIKRLFDEEGANAEELLGVKRRLMA